MKFLELDAMYREYLTTRRALRLDAEGNEALVGLTPAESSEYVAITDTVNIAAKIRAGVDPERFLSLHDLHTAALPYHSSIFDSLGPSIW